MIGEPEAVTAAERPKVQFSHAALTVRTDEPDSVSAVKQGRVRKADALLNSTNVRRRFDEIGDHQLIPTAGNRVAAVNASVLDEGKTTRSVGRKKVAVLLQPLRIKGHCLFKSPLRSSLSSVSRPRATHALYFIEINGETKEGALEPKRREALREPRL